MQLWWYTVTAWTEGKAFSLYFYKISFYFLSGPVKQRPFKDRSLTELVEYGMLLPQTLGCCLLFKSF